MLKFVFKHHLSSRFRPLLYPKYTLKNSENKAPIPIFHVESIFDGFRTIGTRKLGYKSLFNEKFQKSSLQPPPLDLNAPLDPQYTLKNSENKAPTPIFHVESIFRGFRGIGTSKKDQKSFFDCRYP